MPNPSRPAPTRRRIAFAVAWLSLSGYGVSAWCKDESPPARTDAFREPPVEPWLDDGLRASRTDADLRERARRFLQALWRQRPDVASSLLPRAVGLSDFKGNKFLRVAISDPGPVAADRGVLAVRAFQASVVPLLEPLNDLVGGPRSFHGYEVVVYAPWRREGAPHDDPRWVEYRFVMPQSVVKRFCEQDVTAQQLLDRSVVMIDDQRVRLDVR